MLEEIDNPDSGHYVSASFGFASETMIITRGNSLLLIVEISPVPGLM